MAESEKRFQTNPRYERWRWQVFGVTWLAYAGFYLTRKSFAVAKIGLEVDPDVMMSKLAMSWIDFGYLTAYAAGQFVWGMCGDRFGARRIVLLTMFMSVIVGCAMGVSSLVLLFGILMCVQGLCQSGGWAPLTKNMTCWFSQKERGRAMGLWCTNYAAGGAIAAAFAGWAVDHFGDWRYAFFVPAAALSGIWLLFLFLQRNRPEDVGLPSIEAYHGEEEAVLVTDAEASGEGSWSTVLDVLKNRMVIRLCAVYFLLKPARYAILFWGPLYIHEKLGTAAGESAFISIAFEIAGPVSVFSAGYVSDKLFQSRRMPVSITCLFGLSLVLFALNPLANLGSTWILTATLFAVGMLLYAPDSLISSTTVMDFGTKKGASTAAGFVNGFGSAGAILGGALPGYISVRWGWGPLFTAFAIAVAIAALLLLPRWNALPATAHDKK